MLIEEKPLKHWIDYFYGYGSWSARCWFIAYEEGGGDVPEEVADKLNYFYTVHHAATKPTLCDVREMYRHVGVRFDGPKAGLFNNLYEYRFGDNAIQHNVWKNLMTFEQGYRNEEIPDLLSCQKSSFAVSSTNRQALIRLYPLPSPHNHAWYYSWLGLPQCDFLKSRALYEQHVYKRRIHTILTNIIEYKPEIVLMYGMNNINSLKNSAQEFFPGLAFKMYKAIKQQIPQYHRADFGNTTLLITTQIPALRHNRVETGFDWKAFGRIVKSDATARQHQGI